MQNLRLAGHQNTKVRLQRWPCPEVDHGVGVRMQPRIYMSWTCAEVELGWRSLGHRFIGYRPAFQSRGLYDEGEEVRLEEVGTMRRID